MKFIVVGLSDEREPQLDSEVIGIIKQGTVFSGGKRHHELIAHLLPERAEWIDITTPLDAVFEQYEKRETILAEKEVGAPPSIIVFTSGDPLFFGFANTIQRKMPGAELVVYPTFNSLQMLAHRLIMPYHDMRIVSLTGRPWPEFDKALIENVKKIGVLTDREHTPATIAQRMLEYGYSNYKMHVGVHLGNPEGECVSTLTLEEAALAEFEHPNCLILVQTKQATRHFGIPDKDFTLLDGREKMITKMPIRLLTLQALELPHKRVFWDIGFCTGSVSIEARLQFPHLQIEAFEIRPECEAIMQSNVRKLGAPGINIHMGDFLETDITVFPRPDAVFIGGHGGRLKMIIQKILTMLTDDGVIVMNSVTSPKVTTDSHQLWDEACQAFGLRQEPPLRIQLNDYNQIIILKSTIQK